MRLTLTEYLMHEARLKLNKDEPVSEGCLDESKLHEQIAAECKKRGWIAMHGSMAHRAMRTLGEPDFTILADAARVFFVEVKTKSGKLSSKQLGLKMWAEQLGHKIHTVRSLQHFLNIVDNPTAAAGPAVSSPSPHSSHSPVHQASAASERRPA